MVCPSVVNLENAVIRSTCHKKGKICVSTNQVLNTIHHLLTSASRNWHKICLPGLNHIFKPYSLFSLVFVKWSRCWGGCLLPHSQSERLFSCCPDISSPKGQYQGQWLALPLSQLDWGQGMQIKLPPVWYPNKLHLECKKTKICIWIWGQIDRSTLTAAVVESGFFSLPVVPWIPSWQTFP